MGWEIKVWHEVAGDKARVSIEATQSVPDDVISHVISVYWSDEVQGYGGDSDDSSPSEPFSGNRYQG